MIYEGLKIEVICLNNSKSEQKPINQVLNQSTDACGQPLPLPYAIGMDECMKA